ncbi:hypothetical protein [Campylobacter showae]|uniref:Uncharacterized protein n=1 Tax=Campylobacter showae CC57C TaxID=1073353 RepID=M3JBP2_9BACT|nr:hypothetical protein [Campylobacter showae]EMG30082.1 hypothetical protein H740_08256 [Campylobacter showae CC57C]
MLILANQDRPTTKEGFNALIRQNSGGSDEVSEQIIYNVGYLVYCSNIYALRRLKESENARLNLLADKMILKSENERLHSRIKELIEINDELQDELNERGLEIENLNEELTQRSEQ